MAEPGPSLFCPHIPYCSADPTHIQCKSLFPQPALISTSTSLRQAPSPLNWLPPLLALAKAFPLTHKGPPNHPWETNGCRVGDLCSGEGSPPRDPKMKQQPLLCGLPGRLGFMPSSHLLHRGWVTTHLYRRGQRIRVGESFAQNQKLVAKLDSKCSSVVCQVPFWPSPLLLYPAEPSPHPHENDKPMV